MNSPLANRIRPKNLDDIVGQKHILGSNGLLNSVISSKIVPSMIFHGPPGTGKTTAAQIIANQTNKKFYKLNATTASLSDIKNIASEINPITAPNGVLLCLDEIQYFNKKQQQSLLQYMENGEITLIGSTTENPYFYIYSAILSRAAVFEFKLVEEEEIKKALVKAVQFLEKENEIKINTDPPVLEIISKISGGDVRRALNILELCFSSVSAEKGIKTITKNAALTSLENSPVYSYNKTGDEHYNLLSAFQKSMRGSDPNASIYYLARLLDAGDIMSACRRILICASEDIGLAHPSVITNVKALVDIAIQSGMPEAQIPLANAVLLIALSPKSNSAYKSISAAINDIKKGMIYEPPPHLKNINHETYKYPHDYKNHWVKQQYLPSELKSRRYYHPDDNKNETAFKNYWSKTTQE